MFLRQQILNYISETHNIQVIEREYVLLNPHMIKNITYNQHILATYTNGNPYILLFKVIDDVPCCIYIDRKLKNGYSYPKIHCVQYNMKPELFKNENGIWKLDEIRQRGNSKTLDEINLFHCRLYFHKLHM